MSDLLQKHIAHAIVGTNQLSISTALHVNDDTVGDGVAASVPDWVHLVPAGEFSGRDGRGPYRLNGEAVLAAFAKWGADIAIDYEHQGQHAPENGQPAPAAGWIKKMEVRDGELWGFVEWTARAYSFIAAQEYRYLSPVFCFEEKTGVVFLLIGCGLTNSPNLHLTALNSAQFKNLKEAHSMDATQQKAVSELMGRLRYFFGLPELASEVEILDQMKKLISLVENEKTTQAMRANFGANESHASALFLAMHKKFADGEVVAKAQFEEIQAAHTKLLADVDASAREVAFNNAVAAGKILPVHKDMAMHQMAAIGVDAFSTHVDKLPVVGPVKAVATHASAGATGDVKKHSGGVILPAGEVDQDDLARHQLILAYAQKHNVSYRVALNNFMEGA